MRIGQAKSTFAQASKGGEPHAKTAPFILCHTQAGPRACGMVCRQAHALCLGPAMMRDTPDQAEGGKGVDCSYLCTTRAQHCAGWVDTHTQPCLLNTYNVLVLNKAPYKYDI